MITPDTHILKKAYMLVRDYEVDLKFWLQETKEEKQRFLDETNREVSLNETKIFDNKIDHLTNKLMIVNQFLYNFIDLA